MDKKEVKKVVASVIFMVLGFCLAAGIAVYIIFTQIPEIQYAEGSAAFNAYLDAIKFTRIEDQSKWFVFGGTAIIYIAALLFVGSLAMIIVKRSFRFLGLPIVGAIVLEQAAFILQAYYQARVVLGLTNEVPTILLVAAVCHGVLGVLLFFFALLFPARLVKADADEEEAKPEDQPEEKPAEEEKAPEEEVVVAPVEEPEPEKEPEPEPEPVKEPEPVVEEEAAPAPLEEEAAPEVAPQAIEEEEEKPAKKPAKKAPAKKPAKKAEPKPEPEPEPEAPEEEEEAKPEAEAPKSKVVGKYEVFPEAGYFKYRLKANNGEILIVSNPYLTQKSAIAGIETLKKNIPMGNVKVVADKNGRGQFMIFTGNDGRLVAAGEIYPTVAGAEKALASTMRFYLAERVNILDELPESEVREWRYEAAPLEPSPNGKITIEVNEAGKYIASLTANNGEVLFVTATYSTKPAIKKALANLAEKLAEAKNLTIAKDKQDRYQFRLYSDNGMVLLMGQTYPSYESAVSAATSARNFIGQAKVLGE